MNIQSIAVVALIAVCIVLLFMRKSKKIANGEVCECSSKKNCSSCVSECGSKKTTDIR